MEAFKERVLGRTALKVGRLGVAASYGAPAEAFEEAFEQGCNYFYWGSGLRKTGMSQAIRNICGRGRRDRLVVAIQTYARTGLLTERIFKRRLRSMGLTYADALILGWHNQPPSQKLIDRSMKMKEKGLFRFLGMSGHNRSTFPKVAATDDFDILQIRYNAAHRGAEEECFSHFKVDNRPGIVTYTATRHGYLLNPKKMPPGESALTSSDCYRYVMSNTAVDVCLCGPKNTDQMRAALQALELGPMENEEINRVKIIGDHVHQTAKGFF